jgi:hypothetical protein
MSLFDQFNWQGQRDFPYFWGYYWLGPIQPHILPMAPGMTDTVTGVKSWMLLNAGATAITIVTTQPPGPQRVLPASDFLPVGASGFGLKVTSGALVFSKMPAANVFGPGPFVGNSQAGIATKVAGLYMTDATGKNPVFKPDRIGLIIGDIVAKTTPAEPQIPPPAVYQGYYYELQDAQNSGKLT